MMMRKVMNRPTAGAAAPPGERRNSAAKRNGVSAVVDDAVKAVNQSSGGSELSKALKALYSLVYNGQNTNQEYLEAGVAHCAVKALERDPVASEYALQILELMDDSNIRVAMFNIPGFRDIMGPLAIDGDTLALNLMWNMSDSEQLAYSIVTIPGLVNGLTQIMQGPPKEASTIAALSVIRNLTMFPPSQVELLKFPDIVQALLQLTKNESTATKATMAVANLVGKDEVQSGLLRTADNKTLLSIVDILEGVTIESSSYALYEPLLSLRYLSIPQKNRVVLRSRLMKSLPEVLKKAISTNDAVSAGHTVAILSQFAFDLDSLAVLKENKALISSVETVISQGAVQPAAWSSAAHEAEGLMWTLKGGDQTAAPSSVKKDQVMISYNWAHKQLALKIAQFLRSHGFQVWQDVENMKHNVMESMAVAVLESVAVIILVSPQYKESANCQREAMLAAKRQKKIVPLLVVDGYAGDGWLELFISPLLYYDVTSNFDSVMKQVVTNELQGSVEPASNSSGSSSSTVTKLVTVDDVTKHLKASGLEDLADTFAKQEMDGTALRVMHSAWSSGKLSFSEVKELFQISTAGKLFRLKEALNAVYGE